MVRRTFGVSWFDWPIGYLVSRVQLDDLTQNSKFVVRIVRSGMFVQSGTARMGREEEAWGGLGRWSAWWFLAAFLLAFF